MPSIFQVSQSSREPHFFQLSCGDPHLSDPFRGEITIFAVLMCSSIYCVAASHILRQLTNARPIYSGTSENLRGILDVMDTRLFS